MKINAIETPQEPSFGNINLGNGGAKRLLETVDKPTIKKMIKNNFLNECDILITKNTVEIIPPEKNIILKITNKYKAEEDGTLIDVFEHETPTSIKIKKILTEKDINEYGENNKEISLAEHISKFIKMHWDWKKALKINNNSNTLSKIDKDVEELEQYNRFYGSF